MARSAWGPRTFDSGPTTVADVRRHDAGSQRSRSIRSCAAALLIFVALCGPVGWAARAEAAVTTPPSHDETYVTSVFATFLDRRPTPVEAAQATSISMTTVAARAQLVSFLVLSPEWLTATVDKLYVDTLGRPADPSGRAYWLGLLQSGQISPATLGAQFYSSPEYFAGFGQSDLRTWILDLYSKVLLRSGASDAAGVNYWAAVANQLGRSVVAGAIYQSPESCRSRVAAQYVALLGRSPDAAGWAYWAAQLPVLGDLALSTSLASSAEYYGPLAPGQVVIPPPPPRLIDQLASTGGATKIITVESAGWSSTTAQVMTWQRTVVGWLEIAGPWQANVGYNGWSSAQVRREGAGTTPTGMYSFGTGFGLAANPGYSLGWFVVGPNDYWAEDPSRADYNTHQIGPSNPANAPWAASEHLVDYPVAYRYAALINFNEPPSGPYGSGIFLHVSTGRPTAGCVSLPQAELLQILPWIDASTRIVMGPQSVLTSY